MSTGLRVECGWCGVLLREGDPTLPTSHGICPKCQARLEAQIEATA